MAEVASASAAYIELFAYGITLHSERGRPILILKGKEAQEVLPVWLSPLDAGMAISDKAAHFPSPHAVSQKILGALNIEVDRCEFVDMVGHHQYVDIHMRGCEALDKLRVRADEAMSFCLAAGARFFAKQDYMARCRDVDAEMATLEQGLILNPKMVAKNHRYMM